MADDWANSPAGGLDLHLELPRGGKADALAAAIRAAIREGRLAPGTRLPASRALARDLGAARNTIADVYGLLTAEGWLTARTGAGTWVGPRPDAATPPRRVDPWVVPRLDLRGGIPDASSFPRGEWAAAVRRATQSASAAELGYPPPFGLPVLRETLADYLARARGVHVDAARVAVGRGFGELLALVARALHAQGARTIAVEEYGHQTHRDILAAAGLRVVPLAVDADGAEVDRLHADAVLLTPAHQFPTGVPLSAARRASLVEWALGTGGTVIEDDYDGEFRYDFRAIGALQALAPEHVVYLGTASKSLAPAIGVAWAVVPDRVLESLDRARRLTGRGADPLTQRALTDFISGHHYDRHLRRQRAAYRTRRERLADAVAGIPDVRLSGLAAGLQCTLELPPGADEERITALAARDGLVLQGLASYLPEGRPSRRGPALVVGYGAPPAHLVEEAFATLVAAIRQETEAPR
ncbi:MocR-like pyridoxine biosynthesis transcription factor PdxR [Protaetiibacter intestinalis]|uniref:PLP-dependent aminotransferase family protein n=1 Tax=Protaetiibacter intestinalis TaxID=2419774 RepID=A0A387B3P9_9MICO|nr:PLP-dependent aminotransferase family protein [Protaetiibacter intestinalis]AYF96937.1 PLP-dependent aminotransferase family protein [Protaetiibacter intestinalis]